MKLATNALPLSTDLLRNLSAWSSPDDEPELARQHGISVFLRSNDDERLCLLEAVLDDADGEICNVDVAAGVFRAAWDSEPYSDGMRAGNYVTALGADRPDLIGELHIYLEEFGEAMMSPEERAELESMEFPLTIYRGGTGDPKFVSCGTSWTTDKEVADFFAYKWPAKFGDTRTPVVVSKQVSRDNVVAFLNDRDEREILIS